MMLGSVLVLKVMVAGDGGVDNSPHPGVRQRELRRYDGHDHRHAVSREGKDLRAAAHVATDEGPMRAGALPVHAA